MRTTSHLYQFGCQIHRDSSTFVEHHRNSSQTPCNSQKTSIIVICCCSYSTSAQQMLQKIILSLTTKKKKKKSVKKLGVQHITTHEALTIISALRSSPLHTVNTVRQEVPLDYEHVRKEQSLGQEQGRSGAQPEHCSEHVFTDAPLPVGLKHCLLTSLPVPCGTLSRAVHLSISPAASVMGLCHCLSMQLCWYRGK